MPSPSRIPKCTRVFGEPNQADLEGQVSQVISELARCRPAPSRAQIGKAAAMTYRPAAVLGDHRSRSGPNRRHQVLLSSLVWLYFRDFAVADRDTAHLPSNGPANNLLCWQTERGGILVDVIRARLIRLPATALDEEAMAVLAWSRLVAGDQLQAVRICNLRAPFASWIINPSGGVDAPAV